MKSIRSFLLFLAIGIIPQWTIQAQQKYALVIGNGAYKNITRLNNPVNDANDMTAALQSLGFQVDKVLNGSLDQMEDAVIRLKNRLSVNGGAYGFFFYAGHGVQSEGENYLIPVDADIKAESFLRAKALAVQTTLDELNQAGNALNIVVLDACRDNPFSWARSASRGLTVVGSQPADSIIVYATSARETAADGTGRNGLFTEQLLKHLRTPGLEVHEVFTRTGADVQRASGRKQTPAVYNQFFGTAYLGGTAAPQPPWNVRAGTPGTDSVTLSWDSAGAGVTYKVYYGARNDAASATPFAQMTAGTSFNVTGMAGGSIYYFWVSTVKDGRESAKSEVVRVTTAAAPVRPEPARIDMAWIQGGTFMMGSPAADKYHVDDEVQHRVTVSSFYMGRYEVTQEEYQALMGTNPSEFRGAGLPVDSVTWYDAVNYCNALSRAEGRTPAYTVNGTNVTWNRNADGYRLPTEAEWEYACRAGTTTAFNTGNTITTNQANYHGNAHGVYRAETTPVGNFASNPWGLYDMHGNVWEWCWDWYGKYPNGPQTDPAGAAAGTSRVERGGSWFVDVSRCTASYREGFNPAKGGSSLGFRVVRAP